MNINQKHIILGSKSIINRLLILALYHDVDMQIHNANICEDVQETLNIFKVLKIVYKISNNIIFVPHSQKSIIKTDLSDIKTHTLRNTHIKANYMESANIQISEAGTTLRFILPYLAFCNVKDIYIKLGDRLSHRPIDALIQPLKLLGADITKLDNKEIHIRNNNSQRDSDLSIVVDSSQSSQFLTSLILFATSQENKTLILLNGAVSSDSYINITRDLIKLFGFKMIHEKDDIISITKFRQTPTAIKYICDPDYSTVCYLWLFSIIMEKSIIINKPKETCQPDYNFIYLLKDIGYKLTETNDSISIDVKQQISITTKCKLEKYYDMSAMPDQIITMAFLAFFTNTKIVITGCRTLIFKESNRIRGIIENIQLLGGIATYKDDALTIFPSYNHIPNCLLKTFNDHRFAMTFLVLQKKFPQLEIDNTECLKKSYPDFKNLLMSII
jgi:3-phosphoshikimate 1-carboxyvinyltransferase